MLKLNGKSLCDSCFAELNGKRCTHCNGKSNAEIHVTALKNGSILAGKYAVGRVLGKGGFGITYLCLDMTSGKRVAIKEYLPDAFAFRAPGETRVTVNNPDSLQSFKNGAQKFFDEAKTVSKFNGCPNIISVNAFFYENDTAYFVMEYLEGCDLKSYVEQNNGRISIEEAIYVIGRIADALTIVHSQGILHRDISPDNIFLNSEGGVKLIDFGAARQLIGEVSQSLSVILKQGFAPLEQYQKKGNQGPWTDIYALGATMYYALTGKIVDDAMSRLEHSELDTSGIPDGIAAIIEKMLAISIEDRYHSAAELSDDLGLLGITPIAPRLKASEGKTVNHGEDKSSKKEKPQDVSDKSKNKEKNQAEYLQDTEVLGDKTEATPPNNKFVKILIAVIASVVVITTALILVLLPKSSTSSGGGSGGGGVTVSQDKVVHNTPIPEDNDSKSYACGEHLFYTLTDGVLTLIGNGDMYDWSSTEETPWHNDRESITSVVIPQSVTSIGSNAFADCVALESVTLYKGVLKIGDNSFSGCTELRSISIPQSIVSIGSKAFSGCKKIASITIPESVESIGVSAFENWSSTQKIILENSSKTDFGNIGWDNYTYALIIWPNVKEEVSAPIEADKPVAPVTPVTPSKPITPSKPAEVEKPKEPEKPVEVEKPKEPEKPVEKVESGVCGEGLEYVIYSDGKLVVSGNGAISDRPWKNKEALIKHAVIENGVTSIGFEAFYQCKALESITLPESIVEIDESAFYKCENLKAIAIPSGVTFIAAKSFEECTSLESVTLPDGLCEIDESAFSNCSSLKLINIPDGCLTIGKKAFKGCRSLETINLPINIKEIGTNVFSQCSGLISVIIPDSVTKINNYAFAECTSLAEITVSVDLQVIGTHAFDGCCSLTSLVIPDGVTDIGAYAFAGCTGIQTVTVPNSVIKLGASVFSGWTDSQKIIDRTSNLTKRDANWNNGCEAEIIH